MATSMDCTIISAVRNTGTVAAPTAIGADTVSLVITPTKSCNKLLVILTNGGANYTVDIVAGDFWAAKAMTQVTMGAETRVFVFESARFSKYVLNTAASAYDYRIVMTLGAAATTTTYYTVIELP